MLSLRDRNTERKPAFSAGMLGGFTGAALLLGIASLANRGGPSAAYAGSDVTLDDKPRGLISAADQRKQIIERLDRIVVALDRIYGRLPSDDSRLTPRTTR